MNLVMNEDTYKNLPKIIVGSCILLIIGGFGIKFGIVDRIYEIREAKKSHTTITNQIEQLKEITKEFTQVQKEYNQYTDVLLSKTEQGEVDRIELLDMIEDCAFKKAEITNIEVQENNVILTVRSKSLSTLSEVVSNFENHDMTSYVSVSTASSSDTEDNGNVIANIMVQLKSVGEK